MTGTSQTILGHRLPHPQPSGSARRPQLDGTFPDASTAEVSPDEVVGASTFCECSYGCWECDDTAEWRRV